MGNPHRGEVEIEADGETWTLRYTINAIARIERKFDGLPWAKVLGRLFDIENATRDDVIRVFWGGLWHRHRDLTEEDAGDILEAVGETRGLQAVIEALGLANPAPKEGAPARPRKARG